MKKIIYLILFIFLIYLGSVLFIEDKISINKDNPLFIKNNNQEIIFDKKNDSNLKMLEVRSHRNIDINSETIDINNFNKFFNYKNIDFLLKTFILTKDKNLQMSIIKRFHDEIKNPKVINKILDLYKNSNSKIEKYRLSTLLSSINSDDKLDIFYDNLDYTDNDMIADFSSASLETNSKNSTLKLLDLLNNIGNIDYHMEGIKLIYSSADKNSILKVIENDININGFQFSKNQEKFILNILQGSSSDERLIFIQNYGYNFSNQDFISSIKNNSRERY